MEEHRRPQFKSTKVLGPTKLLRNERRRAEASLVVGQRKDQDRPKVLPRNKGEGSTSRAPWKTFRTTSRREGDSRQSQTAKLLAMLEKRRLVGANNVTLAQPPQASESGAGA